MRTISPQLRFNISGYCASAEEVGGDICDVLQIAPGALLLVVADVMGKGTSAAIFAAKLRALIRSLSSKFGGPAELLADLNSLMYGELSESGVFVTAQLALADATAGQLTIASAGHCPLLAARADGRTDAHSPDGMPLGILPQQTFAQKTIPFDHSSSALLHTDGLSEARNSRGDFLGQDYLREWLGQSAARRQSASAMAGNLLAELRRFRSSAPQQDDQAFLLLTAAADRTLVRRGEWTGAARLARQFVPAPEQDRHHLKRAHSLSEFGFEAGASSSGAEQPLHIMTTE